MKISYVVGVRNRFGNRFWNCINSLMHQTYKDIEIIVSIFGGETFCGNDIAFLRENYNVKVIYTKTYEVWNRAKALNIGIRNAKGVYIICTDIDMIFGQKVTEEAVKIWRDLPYAYLYANLYMMAKEDWQDQKIDNIDMDKYFKDYNKFTMVGTGAFQAMSRELWYKYGGYRERFKGWGVEDVDLFQRIRKETEIKKINTDELLHQWHQSEIEKAKEVNDIAFLNAVNETCQMPYGRGQGDL